MNNDLISRGDLINAKPEFLNEKVVRDTKYQTTKSRMYAKVWNACNSEWLNTIKNAPTVEAYPFEQVQELVKLNQQFAQKIENLEKPQPEWVTDELCRLRSCLRSGTHVGSFLQTPAQMDRFIKALDEVIKPN